MLNKNKKFKPGQIVWYMGCGGPIRTRIAWKDVTTTKSEKYTSFKLDNGNNIRGCDDNLFHTKPELLEYWKKIRAKRGY